MSLATLSIDLEARLAKLDATLDQAGRLVEGRMAAMRQTLDSAKTAALGLVGALSVGAVSAYARAVLDGVDALNDFADATGTSVENASALEDVALRTGTAFESVEGALVRFNAQLAAAKPGSEQARLFEKLGLDAAELRRIDPAEALLRTAQALGTYADDGNKARVVQELFGKSVREVAPFLKDLAESGKLNATVTTEQAKAAEDLNKAIFSLSKNLSDMARSVLLPVVKELNALGEAFQGSGRYSAELADSVDAAAVPLQALAVFGANVAYVFRETGREIGAIAAQAAALARLDLSAIDAIRAARVADAQAARRSIDELEARLMRTNTLPGADFSNEGRNRGAGRRSIGDLPGAPDKAKRGPAGANDFMGPELPPALSDALKRIEQADETKLARLRESLAELARLAGQGVAVPNSAFVELAEQINKLDPAAQAMARSQAELNKVMEDGRRVYEATRTPAEVLAAEIDRLNVLLERGAVDWDTYSRAQLDAQARYDQAIGKTKDEADQTRGIAQDLGMVFSSAAEDAIVKWEGFSKLIKGIEQDLVRLITRKLVTEPLAEFVTGGVQGFTGGKGGGGSSGAAALGATFGQAAGQWLSSLFSGGFARGGYIPPGQWGLVGERGPEPAYGGRAGLTVRPGGGNTVVVNMQGGGGATRASQAQTAEAVGREVMAALNRNS